MDDKKKLTDDELDQVAGGTYPEIPELDPYELMKLEKSIDIVRPEGKLPFFITHDGAYSDEELMRLAKELL